MLIEIVTCGTAAFLFGRGIYHSGALTGMIAKGLTQKPEPPVDLAALPDPVAWTPMDEMRQIALYRANPLAVWLDPTFGAWLDGTGSLTGLLPRGAIDADKDHKTAEIAYRNGLTGKRPGPPPPPCPVCKTGRRTVMAIHGGEATMWDCVDCGAEFTRHGETKSSRKKRLARIDTTDDFDDLPQPPKVEDRMTLPCGCDWDTPIHRVDGRGYTYCRCTSCRKWWEPASNSPSGRVLAQGEKVWPANEAGAIPRPDCPQCRRSHPTLNTPIDGSKSFYRCSGCRHEWKTSKDVDDACHHRYSSVRKPEKATK